MLLFLLLFMFFRQLFLRLFHLIDFSLSLGQDKGSCCLFFIGGFNLLLHLFEVIILLTAKCLDYIDFFSVFYSFHLRDVCSFDLDAGPSVDLSHELGMSVPPPVGPLDAKSSSSLDSDEGEYGLLSHDATPHFLEQNSLDSPLAEVIHHSTLQPSLSESPLQPHDDGYVLCSKLGDTISPALPVDVA